MPNLCKKRRFSCRTLRLELIVMIAIKAYELGVFFTASADVGNVILNTNVLVTGNLIRRSNSFVVRSKIVQYYNLHKLYTYFHVIFILILNNFMRTSKQKIRPKVASFRANLCMEIYDVI